MQKIIGVTELRRRFRSIVDEVAKKGTSFVLTRRNRFEAVLIPYKGYLRFQQMEEGQFLGRFEKVRQRLAELNANVSDEEMVADIAAARQKAYGQVEHLSQSLRDSGLTAAELYEASRDELEDRT